MPMITGIGDCFTLIHSSLYHAGHRSRQSVFSRDLNELSVSLIFVQFRNWVMDLTGMSQQEKYPKYDYQLI